MKYYRLEYEDGTKEFVKAESDLALVRAYDLASKKHINTKVIQYEEDSLSFATDALETIG